MTRCQEATRREAEEADARSQALCRRGLGRVRGPPRAEGTSTLNWNLQFLILGHDCNLKLNRKLRVVRRHKGQVGARRHGPVGSSLNALTTFRGRFEYPPGAHVGVWDEISGQLLIQGRK